MFPSRCVCVCGSTKACVLFWSDILLKRFSFCSYILKFEWCLEVKLIFRNTCFYRCIFFPIRHFVEANLCDSSRFCNVGPFPMSKVINDFADSVSPDLGGSTQHSPSSQPEHWCLGKKWSYNISWQDLNQTQHTWQSHCPCQYTTEVRCPKHISWYIYLSIFFLVVFSWRFEPTTWN